jgi:hypothetical protein
MKKKMQVYATNLASMGKELVQFAGAAVQLAQQNVEDFCALIIVQHAVIT